MPMYLLGFQDCRWRRTGNCSQHVVHGEVLLFDREHKKDKSCNAPIDDGESGFCECADGRIPMRKGCQAGKYKTCKEACSGM